MPPGDGRFNDSELDKLITAMRDPTSASAYYAVLFAELVTGAREAHDDDERERYGIQALIVSTALTAAQASHDVHALKTEMRSLAIEHGATLYLDRIDELGERIAAQERALDWLRGEVAAYSERTDTHVAELKQLAIDLHEQTDDGVARVIASK